MVPPYLGLKVNFALDVHDVDDHIVIHCCHIIVIIIIYHCHSLTATVSVQSIMVTITNGVSKSTSSLFTPILTHLHTQFYVYMYMKPCKWGQQGEDELVLLSPDKNISSNHII